MPFISKLQSLIEVQLTGMGPPELVSIAAELVVAAAVFCPLFLAVRLAGWLLKRSRPAH
jgi:hypothetical protein